eukprot:GILI01001564.1.p1 GENE.GILI01001564.1~~GILI01001564.1.p1  ORF type:complete len:226 (+),score=78.18 GILI01001564.1:62-679(+)
MSTEENKPVEHEEGTHGDEECTAEFQSLVSLPEVPTVTGEEDEECVLKLRSKVYRWCKDEKMWKERGTGDVKLLKSKENKRVRVLLREEKTLKIRLNHYVSSRDPYCKLVENAGNDKSWTWIASDFADQEAKVEQFAIRFQNVENAQKFKKAFAVARTIDAKLSAGETPDDSELPVLVEAPPEEGSVKAVAAAAAAAAGSSSSSN